MYGIYSSSIKKHNVVLDLQGVFMSHSKKRHDHEDKKKQHKDSDSVSQTLKDESLNPKRDGSSKTKSFNEIIKGFKEIEKIEQTDSSLAPPTQISESPDMKQAGSSKSKSYAEIIKGFQEIEKIISNSQKPE